MPCKLSWLIALLTLLTTLNSHAEDTLPFYNSPEFTPHWLHPKHVAHTGFHHIPAFEFINQHGQPVTEASVANKMYVAHFFFTTCPGICPAIKSKLMRVYDAYSGDEQLRILSHSIRPQHDTVATLHAYAQRNGIEGHGWHLLTGDRDALYRLAKDYYFASEDLGELQQEDDFLHTENLLLIDSQRRIRGIYNGLSSASVRHLISDIALLKQERNAD